MDFVKLVKNNAVKLEDILVPCKIYGYFDANVIASSCELASQSQDLMLNSTLQLLKIVQDDETYVLMLIFALLENADLAFLKSVQKCVHKMILYKIEHVAKLPSGIVFPKSMQELEMLRKAIFSFFRR